MIPTAKSRARVAGNPFTLRALAAPGLLPLAVAAILIVIFSILQEAFFTWPNAWNIARQSSVLLVAGMSATFVIILGCIDLSIGQVMALAAIVASSTYGQLGNASLALGLLVGASCGLVNGFLHAVMRLPSFLVTLGTLFVFQSIGLIVSGGRPQPWSTPLTDWLAGGVIFGAIPKIGLWAVGVLIICAFIAAKTRYGQMIYAVGDNERTSRMAGLPTTAIKVGVFVFSGFVSALAGMLLGIRSFSAAPGMGDSFLLDTIAAVVLGGTLLTGGIGGPLRTVAGVLIIVLLANGMTLLQVDQFFQIGIRGAVVIAAVLFAMWRRTTDEIVK